MLLTFVAPLLTSLLIAVFSIPLIIKVADLKHLMDEPDDLRKFHTTRTPTLGGVAIFAGTLFSYTAFSDYLKTEVISFLTPALIILFFAGVKDDILVLSPGKKLGAQMICAVLVTFLGQLRLTNLWGIFGFYEISPLMGSILTFFIIVSLVNAYNLVDGVNGLAASLGIAATLCFGTWFLIAQYESQAILSFALVGSLVGFMYFNCNQKARIFMGDTGSMTVGFIIAILAISFIESQSPLYTKDSAYYLKAAPVIALAAVFLPLFDMTRVFFYRVWKKRSPFRADRSHLHHILLDAGCSHIQVTVLLTSLAIANMILTFLLREIPKFEITVVLFASMTFTTASSIIAKSRYKKKSHSQEAKSFKYMGL